MLDIKQIRDRTDEIRHGLTARGADLALLNRVLELDQRRRRDVTRLEEEKSRKNHVSREIGELRRRGEDTTETQAEVRRLGESIDAMEAPLREVEQALRDALLRLPNVPHADVPVGPDASGNRVVSEVGTPRTFDFAPRDHVGLGEALGLFDFERAARMSGAGFPLLTGVGARLQRALIQFMLELHISQHGYTEVLPPLLVRSDTMTGTGQLPKMAEDMYHCPNDDLWLIPTAEVPVTNLFREEILDGAQLPLCRTACTPCFRREAGAAGRETRGLIRVHQFDKVELVRWVAPETSAAQLLLLRSHAENVLKALALPYRVVALCTGDLSFAAATCYDIELWAPGQNAWLEVSSCSNFGDFQARRAGIRYRDAEGTVRFVHTLNGSGVALPRLMVALLENGQQSDGSVQLPPVLVPYMGGMERLVVA